MVGAAAVRFLALMLLVGCASCRTSMRTVPICMIDVSVSKAFCNEADEQFQLQFPLQMLEYTAFSPEAQDTLADIIEACNQCHKIPRDSDPIGDAETCVIDADSCSAKSLASIDLWYAVDRLTWNKFKRKIESCKR